MSNDTKYNGWNNYETWCANLWLENDEGTASMMAEMAQSAWDDAEAGEIYTREQSARYALAESLKDVFEDMRADWKPFGASVFDDLLDAAMSEIDWHEIAEAALSAVDKEEEPADAQAE